MPSKNKVVIKNNWDNEFKKEHNTKNKKYSNIFF